MTFEQKSPTEDRDIDEIVRGILAIQKRYAVQQKRPLGRGTHTKGVCVRATFEVFDVSKTIGDPVLAARLAKGLFAKPGVYPATVRFANAASTIRADAKQDVRAMSFAVELPAGAGGPAPTRVDFSMNNATTFPINDAHAFASLMKVDTADGAAAKLKGLFALSFRDIWGIVQTAKKGKRQERGPVKPYQQMRYWSNVPFAHGADEAVKYSAIPAATNPALPLNAGDNELRDELVRHINEDAQMSSFDFALQLLEANRMTIGGRRQNASFWIENASAEWNEAEAPFFSVGRLTLVGASHLPADACESMFIDVTEHSLADHKPLGSINRARWAAESASRKARLSAAPVGVPAMSESAAAQPDRPGVRLIRAIRSVRRRIGSVTVGTVVRTVLGVTAALLLIVGLVSCGTMVALDKGWGMLPDEPRHPVVYADQGWGPGVESADRQTYYYTPQGAGVKDMRYSWFVNLEMPWGRERFADPSVLGRYGFVVDEVTAGNPDGLPVGFTKHFDRQLNEELLDVTCAACHTGQLNVTRNGRTTALRIDGGSALHAFTDANIGHFVPTMVSAMVSTAANPFKFNRFARKVLGNRYPQGRWTLHRELRGVIGNFASMGWNEKTRGLAPTEEGYGRTDALARISNTVFGENLDPKNYKVGNAPVSYPPVWNIWKFDWVQYNASVSQPMARNIGESMGTGAKYDLVDRYGRPLPPEERFRSTALLENLHTIELTLRKLQPPAWPEHVLGPIDRAKAERGKTLFNEHCVSCHGPHIAPPAIRTRNAPLKTDADPEWIVRTLCVDDIGTDPNTAVNFANATVDLTRTGLTAVDLRRVARTNFERWNEREAAYVTVEIARLRAQPATADTARQIATLEGELEGLPAYMEHALSQIRPDAVPVGNALSYLGTMIRDKAYADLHYTPEQMADRDGFGILDMPQVLPAYKPRPLAGVWATPPYLHNGSVPTIFDLLSPVDERPKTFRVGSREFDPVKVGLAAQTEGFWEFETSKTGNHNTGHEFSRGYDEAKEGQPSQKGYIGPFLPPEDRLAILEHLKIRNDDVDGPKEPRMPPQCVP